MDGILDYDDYIEVECYKFNPSRFSKEFRSRKNISDSFQYQNGGQSSVCYSARMNDKVDGGIQNVVMVFTCR